MNPDEIKAWALGGHRSTKEAISLLTSGTKKEEAERAVARAEQEMKEAEASAAKKLGFEICPRCWPPEIMTIVGGAIKNGVIPSAAEAAADTSLSGMVKITGLPAYIEWKAQHKK
ncbi:MAG: hypothetical protein EXS42_07925 [Lacunisphaera sp.]|nr:hypothetical protein [Lacunisphaera sp.]